MASGQPGSSSQQPFSYPHPAPVSAAHNVASPPTKQSLKTWAKWFKPPAKTQETQGNNFSFYRAIFGQSVSCKKKMSKNNLLGFKFPRSMFAISQLPKNLTSKFQEAGLGDLEPVADGACDLTLPTLETSNLSAIPSLSPSMPQTERVSSTGSFGKSIASTLQLPVEDEISSIHHPVLGRSSPAKEASPQIKRHTMGRSNRFSRTANNHRDSSEPIGARKLPRPKLRPFSTMFDFIQRAPSTPPFETIAEQTELAVEAPVGIFGVPLRQSITYANVAISLVDAEGKSYIYGYVPIVVAKCGVYLKEKATNVEGIFRLAGSEKRIKELRAIFDSPDRYGKGLNWTGYTVHDAANVLRRYLNQLPEPIVPLNLYHQFRAPLKGYTKQAVGDNEGTQSADSFDVAKAIKTYQNLITELPPLNRQLLLYILDLLAVFASKADENRMNSQNLAAIFQPGMLSHPDHDMAPPEYRLSQDVLIFLIENQDHFLIGMRGTAADEQTVQEVQNGGTPPPGTPNPKNNVRRSISNASAGADDVRKHGGVRRNVSVSSRHSRQSNGAPSPASPAYPTPTTGVHRSNTLPSKRSPALPSSRLQKNSGSSSPNNGLVFGPPSTTEDAAPGITAQIVSFSEPRDPRAVGTSSLAPTSNPTSATSQERLLPDAGQPLTPTREKPGFFSRSPTIESEKKAPNKLRKKRIPGGNQSAHSSTQSLDGQSALAPSPLSNPELRAQDVEYKPLEVIQSASSEQSISEFSPPAEAMRHAALVQRPAQEHRPERLEPQAQRPEEPHRTSDKTLKPLASPTSSLHSHSSINDMSHSDVDHLDDVTSGTDTKERKSRWRMSRRRDDPQSLGANLSPRKGLGMDGNAGASSSSIGSSARPRKSFTGDSLPAGSESNISTTHAQSSNESGSAHAAEEKKGPLVWIKNKMREKQEEKRERDAVKERNKSPPASTDRHTSPFGLRGKSMDIKRDEHPKAIAEEPAMPRSAPHPQQPESHSPKPIPSENGSQSQQNDSQQAHLQPVSSTKPQSEGHFEKPAQEQQAPKPEVPATEEQSKPNPNVN